jgi:hypothetical protein
MLLPLSEQAARGRGDKAVCGVVDSVFNELDQLNDRKYRTLQNEMYAL